MSPLVIQIALIIISFGCIFFYIKRLNNPTIIGKKRLVTRIVATSIYLLIVFFLLAGPHLSDNTSIPPLLGGSFLIIVFLGLSALHYYKYKISPQSFNEIKAVSIYPVLLIHLSICTHFIKPFLTLSESNELIFKTVGFIPLILATLILFLQSREK